MKPNTVRKVRVIVVWPGLAMTLLAAAASAQSDQEVLTELRECAQIRIDRARLDCFDGVFANENLTDGSAAAAGATAGAASPAASSAGAAGAGLPGAATEAPGEAPGEARGAPRADRPLAAPRDAEEPPAERIVTVVEVTELSRGNFRFVTSDGAIYTQPLGTPSRRSYPSVPFRAELYSGAFSSLFIRPVEGGAQTRVVAED